MELKQVTVALWNQMDGRIVLLFHDYVKYLHLSRIDIIISQKNSFRNQVFSEEGYATPLGWGDNLPDSDSPEWQ